MPAAEVDLESQLADDISAYTHDPLGYANYAFPWGYEGLAASEGPRPWQSDILKIIGKHLQGDATRHQPLRVAIASGHGIGKSALVGMIIAWAMSTCEDCKVVVTAGTGTQLETKTVPEVTTWFNKAINANWFNVNATSIRAKEDKHQAIWRTDFITWSERNTEPFAGLHNKGKRIVLIFDEASAVADAVWDVAQGALTDEGTEIIWLAFGNPTRTNGSFRECFGKNAHRWNHRQIDSRTVEGTNKEEIAKWIEDEGEDSDYVRIRVRGEFPRAGATQFISSDDVAACRKYKAQSYEAMPKILAVDVARYGDDQTVIGLRQGRHFKILAKYRGLDTVQTAERTIEFIQSQKPQATVIDGDGLGAGVVDHLVHRGFKPFEFHGGATPRDPAAYSNRRTEVWGLVKGWLKAGAQIPDEAELAEDLTVPEYYFTNKQQIQLEKKEDMKKRGFRSPDAGDCLAMTFGVTVAPPTPQEKEPMPSYGSQAWMA